MTVYQWDDELDGTLREDDPAGVVSAALYGGEPVYPPTPQASA